MVHWQNPPFRELRFIGGRFDDTEGWLDFDVLQEFQVYRRLVVEVAKEVWRLDNPDRERLPSNFESGLRMGFTNIGSGSCVVSVHRVPRIKDGTFKLDIPDVFDHAAQLIDDTLVAVELDAKLPGRLSTRVLPLFADLGRTLNSDESIMFIGDGDATPTLNAKVRDSLLARIEWTEYEDQIELIGEVRAADLRQTEGGSFEIRLGSGDSVSGNFTHQQESLITSALHEHSSVHVRLLGIGRFDDEGKLARIQRIDQLERIPVQGPPFDSTAPTMFELFESVRRDVPDSAWADIPSDLAANVDHYLYGHRRNIGQ